MTTPTPPPGMEIWKLAGTISDERLPEGAFYWNDSATYPRWEEATSEYPRDWLTYAVPIHPATGDAKPRKSDVFWNCAAHGPTIGECQCGAQTSSVTVSKPAEQGQELLPCPFCGSHVSRLKDRIHCQHPPGDCWASGYQFTISEWNTRK